MVGRVASHREIHSGEVRGARNSAAGQDAAREGGHQPVDRIRSAQLVPAAAAHDEGDLRSESHGASAGRRADRQMHRGAGAGQWPQM